MIQRSIVQNVFALYPTNESSFSVARLSQFKLEYALVFFLVHIIVVFKIVLIGRG